MKTKLILTMVAMCLATMCMAQEDKLVVNTTSGPIKGIMQEETMA